MNSKKLSSIVMVFVLSLGGAVVQAEDLCLTGFGGLVYRLNFQQFFPLSGSSTGPITGRQTGGADCGTLGGGIPLTGSANLDGSNLNLGFNVHAIDVPNCGSVEYKVIVNLTTLSGPLDLWNAKNAFENTGTVTLGALPFQHGKTTRVYGGFEGRVGKLPEIRTASSRRVARPVGHGATASRQACSHAPRPCNKPIQSVPAADQPQSYDRAEVSLRRAAKKAAPSGPSPQHQKRQPRARPL